MILEVTVTGCCIAIKYKAFCGCISLNLILNCLASNCTVI